MPPRRARVPATLESRIKQGLQYFAGLREDEAADVARAKDLGDALLEADMNIISNTGILSGIVAAHAWAARALAVDVLNDSAYVAFVATATNLGELLSSQPGDQAYGRQDRLVRALLRADTLAVHARLCTDARAHPRGRRPPQPPATGCNQAGSGMACPPEPLHDCPICEQQPGCWPQARAGDGAGAHAAARARRAGAAKRRPGHSARIQRRNFRGGCSFGNGAST